MKESEKEFEGCGSYSVGIASKMGAVPSILVLHIHMHMRKNQSKIEFHVDGKIWVRSTVLEITKATGITKRQIECAAKKCVEWGLMEKAKHSGKSLNQTCWYTLTEKAIEMHKGHTKTRGE